MHVMQFQVDHLSNVDLLK